jgi:hypothetical protein
MVHAQRSPSAACAHEVCPTPKQQPKCHVSMRGFSSIVKTIFLKFINDDDNNNNSNF